MNNPPITRNSYEKSQNYIPDPALKETEPRRVGYYRGSRAPPMYRSSRELQSEYERYDDHRNDNRVGWNDMRPPLDQKMYMQHMDKQRRHSNFDEYGSIRTPYPVRRYRDHGYPEPPENIYVMRGENGIPKYVRKQQQQQQQQKQQQQQQHSQYATPRYFDQSIEKNIRAPMPPSRKRWREENHSSYALREAAAAAAPRQQQRGGGGVGDNLSYYVDLAEANLSNAKELSDMVEAAATLAATASPPKRIKRVPSPPPLAVVEDNKGPSSDFRRLPLPTVKPRGDTTKTSAAGGGGAGSKSSKVKKRPVCKECGKTYATTGTLNRHMRIHRDERPYMCSQCHRSFRQRSHLIAHFVVHNKEKNHKCEDCGKHFAQKSSLVGHRRTQHPNRFYYQQQQQQQQQSVRNTGTTNKYRVEPS